MEARLDKIVVDVVYPLSNGSRWDNNELRYSLRSLEKYAINLGKVFIVGTPPQPEWLTGVEYIRKGDPNRRNKDANIINKVRAAIAAGISEHFIFASDDQYLTNMIDLTTLPVTYGRHDHDSQTRWRQRMKHTCDYLTAKGLPCVYYDTHLFQPHSASHFEQCVASVPYDDDLGFCINTLVLNHVPNITSVASGKIRGKYMRGYDDRSLAHLKVEMPLMFPIPSHFELLGPFPEKVPTMQEKVSLAKERAKPTLEQEVKTIRRLITMKSPAIAKRITCNPFGYSAKQLLAAMDGDTADIIRKHIGFAKKTRRVRVSAKTAKRLGLKQGCGCGGG